MSSYCTSEEQSGEALTVLPALAYAAAIDGMPAGTTADDQDDHAESDPDGRHQLEPTARLLAKLGMRCALAARRGVLSQRLGPGTCTRRRNRRRLRGHLQPGRPALSVRTRARDAVSRPRDVRLQ